MDVSLSTLQLFYIVAILAIVLIGCIIGVLLLARKVRHLSTALSSQEAASSALQQQVSLRLKEVENQQAEAQTRAVVVGKHMQQLDGEIKQIENQLREVKNLDPSARLYQQAAEMVRQGATIEEVMQACDLPRAEAEMLISMHR